jgi:ATP-dependent DNA ligase
LLYLNGWDLREAPLIERKMLLERALRFRDPLRFTEHRERDGEAYFREACRRRLEGLVGKRVRSAYVSRRTRDWRKIRCSCEQELVIGGYTEPQGQRTGFGALLLGYYDKKRLRYAGKVGTGFDTRLLKSLGKELAQLEAAKSPFAEPVRAGPGVHWVKPKLVAQVAFTEWTRDGMLRHPRFLGLRRDRDPAEVARERTS